LETMLSSYHEEYKLATAKLKEWQEKPAQDSAVENIENYQQTVDSFKQQIKELQDNINANKMQQQAIAKMLQAYDGKTDKNKLLMFNSEHVLTPILKGLEGINAQGMKVMYHENTLETEMMLN